MPFLSRVITLAACWGLLLPWADLAACRLPISKGADKHRVAVSGWDGHAGFGGRAGNRTGERFLQPRKELRLAKAPTSTRKKG